MIVDVQFNDPDEWESEDDGDAFSWSSSFQDSVKSNDNDEQHK